MAIYLKATFDGDSIYMYLLLDLESKLKAYGSLPHHQMLDPNKLFKISGNAGQSKTNLLNLHVTLERAKRRLEIECR